MYRALTILLLTLAIGCGPSSKDFQGDYKRALEAYRKAPDAQSAIIPLRNWEKQLANYATAGIKDQSIEYHHMVLYGRLHALHSHLQQTNEARECRQKILHWMERQSGHPIQNWNADRFFESVKKIDEEHQVAWRRKTQ